MDKGNPRSARACCVVLVAVLLGACAQAGVPAARACEPSAAASSVPIRVLIGFTQAVDGASGPVLRQLQTHSQGCVQALSSVSPMLHVYQFTGVDGVDRLSQRLQAWPLVKSVTPDARVPPQPAP